MTEQASISGKIAILKLSVKIKCLIRAYGENMKMRFFTFLVSGIFFSACNLGVEIEYIECITSQDCPDGHYCRNNECISYGFPDELNTYDNSEEVCDSDTEFDDSSVEMVKVPAGFFWMGCNEEVTSNCEYEYETPQLKVYLDEFYIDKYEVTASQYEKCVEACVCEPIHTTSYCNFKASGKGNHPINCINWYQADTYCRWAGKKLPTEAQWEKAARGGCELYDYCEHLTPIYPWGNVGSGCEYAVFSSCEGTGTRPVGSLEAGKSPYGCYDMSGNVSEWVNDWWGYYDYSESPSINPQGPDSSWAKVMRGGGWNNSMVDSYSRYNRELESTHGSEGFRCAKSSE